MRAAFFYSRAKLFITIRFGGGAYVVVRFCPWFKFYFLLFLGVVMYGNDFESKENKIWTRDKIEPQNLFTVNCELKLWTVSFHLSPWSAFGGLILNCVIQRRFDKINVILLSLNFLRSAICIYRLAKIMGFFDLWYDHSVIFFSSQVWVKAHCMSLEIFTQTKEVNGNIMIQLISYCNESHSCMMILEELQANI